VPAPSPATIELCSAGYAREAARNATTMNPAATNIDQKNTIMTSAGEVIHVTAARGNCRTVSSMNIPAGRFSPDA